MRLRLAGAVDAMALARVHVCSWQAAYKGLLPEDYLAGFRPEDRARRYTFDAPAGEGPQTALAEWGGQVMGFATIGPARDNDRRGSGELYALYVHPNRWGQGLGRVLMVDARRRLIEAGFTTALLWVLGGNDRAQRFYRSDGWSADGSRRHQRTHGIVVDEMRYERTLV